MTPFTSKIIWLSALLALGELTARAQAVRVTAWDVAAPAQPGKTAPASVEEIAQKLKQLAPDVVLLRRVTGWKMCSQLAEAMKPADYRVVACSAFHDSGANVGVAPNQVAILARNAAYFSWSEPWNLQVGRSAAGGFAFAALQVGGHRLGFSCLEIPGGQLPLEEEAVRQWLKTLDTYRGWANNRLEGFVAATFGANFESGETGRLLRGTGFEIPSSVKTAITERAHLVPNADSPAGLLFSQWPTTCDFDFRAAPVVVVAAPPVETAAAAPTQSPNALFKGSALAWWIGGATAFILVTIVVLQLGLRRRLARLQAQGGLPMAAGAYNVVIAPPAPQMIENGPAVQPQPVSPARSAREQEMLRQGLLTHLAEWFKHAVIQRLVRDREKLAVTQQEATMKILAVDDRLARLEAKIHKETSSYEKQIEQLSRELLTAREENLELIRAQITLLKSEMETARARVLESDLS
jgi:hypothetical protein